MPTPTATRQPLRPDDARLGQDEEPELLAAGHQARGDGAIPRTARPQRQALVLGQQPEDGEPDERAGEHEDPEVHPRPRDRVLPA